MQRDHGAGFMYDLVLPTLLFAALGGMTWAVRGCSGYGAVNGCVFAGVTWGAAWWYIAHEPGGRQSRRYASGWIVLALAFGIGLSGARGWMQWPSFFEGRLLLDAPHNKFVPISRVYGFVWLFIAGAPWAGIGACMLAWCGSQRPVRAGGWCVRIACGVAGVLTARLLFESCPGVFLPLYGALKEQYQDFQTNPNLRRLVGDNRLAIEHLGLYVGFLAYEIGRKDWKNVTLISVVGVLNGFGWSLCQNWRWASGMWPGSSFNWWRCWESSGGISIGIAYGIAYYLVNRRVSEAEQTLSEVHLTSTRPNLERFGLYLGLVFGLGFSVKNGLKGWANIHLGNEAYWSGVFAMVIYPLCALLLAVLAYRVLSRPLARDRRVDIFPHAYKLIWVVLIVQNVLAQLVTGPWTEWNEMVFKAYYVFLFILSGVIVYHYRCVKECCSAGKNQSASSSA